MSLRLETDLTLLMTASIDPKGMRLAANVADPKSREDDYARSIQYYLTHHPRVKRIAFVENSGWPLDRLRSLTSENPFGKSVEFLSFRLNDFPRHLGKSYGEALLIDHAMAESKLVKESPYTAKVTGRICMQNMTRLLERLHTPFDLACDLRDHPFYDWLHLNWCGHSGDTRFFVFTPAFYDQNLKGRFVELDDSAGHLIEHLLFRIAKETRAPNRVIRRFPVEPHYVGVAGHFDNKSYDSTRERGKRMVRGATRRILPWLHI